LAPENKVYSEGAEAELQVPMKRERRALQAALSASVHKPEETLSRNLARSATAHSPHEWQSEAKVNRKAPASQPITG
jgi:hypothetical protein